ncbi:MAG: uracil-DNA glycosylase, partial [Ornithinibacter sp.]
MSPTTPARPLGELVHPSWAQALAPVEPVVSQLGEFLRREVAAGRGYLPGGAYVLRAFERPLDAVRVLIVGQDPYPTPGHAVGLSFSVGPDVRPVPRSLANIYRELETALGLPTPSTGDLTPWAD